MRIVHLANFYGPRSGGVRTTMQALGRGYLEAGHDPVLVVPGKREQRTRTDAGLVIEVPAPIIPGTGGYRMMTRPGELRQLLRGLKPDVLEVSDRTTLLPLGRWARSQGIPAVAFAHERVDRLLAQYSHLQTARWQTLADRWNQQLSEAFDLVIATTGFAATEFERIQAPNLVNVPLGVDLNTFHPRYTTRVPHQGGIVRLVHCGRLSPEKHADVSIDTLAALIDQGIAAELVVLGSGPRETALRRRARKLPVYFLGHVSSRQQVARSLANADICLAPGPHETFGLAALEALACGTPVVASAHSALPEILGAGGRGATDVAGFAAAVQELIALGATERQRRARSVAVRYPWHRTTDSMLALPTHGRRVLTSHQQ